MYLILAWVVICLFSPAIGYAYDKWKGLDGPDAKNGSGPYEIRYSAVMVIMLATPLLIIGLIVNWLAQ